jgi:hypothetical protein
MIYALLSLVWKKKAALAALVLFILMLPCALPAQDFENFTSNLTSGTPQGNITITYENSVMEPETPGLYHLLMDKPGASILKGTFTLKKVPDKLYIQINHKSTTLHDLSSNPTYAIYVNGQKSHSMEIYFDKYTILGYEITPQVRQGTNDFSIILEGTAKTSICIRQVDVSPIVSFVEQYTGKKKPQNLYLLIPLYLAYFFLIAITISYLLFVIMWRNRFDPHGATIIALLLCGMSFAILPFLIFGWNLYPMVARLFGWQISLYNPLHWLMYPLYTLAASLIGTIVGIVWMIRMHK